MSMPCKCGGESRCVDSRVTRDGHVRRRYACTDKTCGRRWSTLEVSIGTPKRGTNVLATLKKRIELKAMERNANG